MEQALIIDIVALVAILEADLGRHRKIGPFRIVRPLIVAGAVVPLYLQGLATAGAGLTLEVALTAAGILLGLAAVALMNVYRSPKTGRPVSRAGLGYAFFLVVIFGSRALFSYGSAHWFGPQLAHWMARNGISGAALTDALIFMAIAMMLTRTLGLLARAQAVRSNPASVGAAVRVS